MAKLMYLSCLIGVWLTETAAEDKWVWSGSERSAKLSKGPGGRYGVFEETVDIPNEPYNPLIRPPPSNLPPLVRPSSDGRPLDRPYDVRPRPPTGLGAYYNQPDYNRPDINRPDFNRPDFNRPDNNRPDFNRPDNNRPDFNRPDYNRPDYNRPGVTGSDRLPIAGGLDRPYNRPNNGFNNNRYPVNGPNQSFRPPPPPTKPGLVDHEDSDPTKFDKCKCTHSFNCKSPGIVFGSCDVGKKYCCEKRIHHSNGISLAGDGPIPEVLAGPGGPVDHLKPQQGAYPNRGNNFGAGQLEPRRP